MDGIEQAVLARPDVQAALELWREAVAEGKFLQLKGLFLWLLQKFLQGTAQRAIARESGVSHELIRQIYNEFFYDICGRLGGHERQTLRARQRAQEAAIQANESLRTIIQTALRADLDAEVMFRKGSNTIVSSKWVMVRGRVCSVLHYGPKTKHLIIRRRPLRRVWGVIFYSRVSEMEVRMHVMPSATLVRLYFTGQNYERSEISVQLPLDEMYRDAWHLIPPKRR